MQGRLQAVLVNVGAAFDFHAGKKRSCAAVDASLRAWSGCTGFATNRVVSGGGI